MNINGAQAIIECLKKKVYLSYSAIPVAPC